MELELVDVGLESPALLRARCEAIELPSAYSEYGVFVAALRESGVLGALGERVLSRRAGSYELVDLVLFLACFFSSSTNTMSIGGFAEHSASYGPELAGLGDRRRWPTQASVSRCLGAVDAELAQEVSRLLLGLSRAALRDSVLCRGSGYRDAEGVGWRVLHWDATVDTLRRRALPESAELPDGKRLGEALARAGFSGRKRGEVVFSRSIVSDATSSLWVHMDLDCGGGSASEQIGRAVRESVAYLEDFPEGLEQTVMVCDGVSGGLPQARALRASQMHVLTRFSDYACLQRPDAVRRLERGLWMAVEDALSGPRREALELGTRTVGTERLRLIVSRFATGDGKGRTSRGAGITIGPWHYELFLTSVPSSRWAANDVVTLYYGRTAIENRFAAEDKAFALSRVFSYSQPGQQLASAVAMALWNHRIVCGLASVSERVPERAVRVRKMPESVERDADQVPEPQAPSHGAAEDNSRPALPATPPAAMSRPPQPSVDVGTLEDHAARIKEVTVSWCARNADWSYETGQLRCPAGRTMHAMLRNHCGEVSVRFRAPSRVCFACPLRSGCTQTQSASYRKELAFPLLRLAVSPPPQSHASDNASGTSVLPRSPALPATLPDAPILLPAVLRRHAGELFAALAFRVWLPPLEPIRTDPQDAEPDESSPHEPDETHFADTPEARQRRRQTIADRVAANARPQIAAAKVVLKTTSRFAGRIHRLKAMARSA